MLQGQLMLTQFAIGVEQSTIRADQGNGPEDIDTIMLVLRIPVDASILVPLTHDAAAEAAHSLAERMTDEERKVLVSRIMQLDSQIVLATPATLDRHINTQKAIGLG